MITRLLAGVAIAFGSLVVGATPASADTGPSDPGPNPFANLTCDCSAPASVPNAELQRGLSTGLASQPRGTGSGEPSR